MTTFTPTLKEFHDNAKVFFDTLPLCTTYEQMDNGYKALLLLYVGLPETLTEREQYEVQMVIEIAGKKMLDHHLKMVFDHG